MKHFKLTLSCIATAALLTACGGDDGKIQFTQVVTFGDSISDSGAYKVGTIAQLGGGKFTVNGLRDSVWPEALAANLGVPAQCSAQTGLQPNNDITGAPVVNIATCYNYAQGSGRVTAVGSGPGGVALQMAFNEKNEGKLADSIQNQMNRHLAKAPTFGANELVTVNGGGNDFFMQLTAVGAAGGGGPGAVATGTVAGWSAATLTIVGDGGPTASGAAAGAAVAGMGQAGAELASYVKSLIVAKGARYVVVRNLGDLNGTPFGSTFDAGTKQLSTAMITTFNDQLKLGLTGLAGVVYFDDYAWGQASLANLAMSGYSNIAGAACGRDAFSAAGDVIGSSLICNAKTLIPVDTSKYFFADSVHPTPYAHQNAANYTVTLMRKAGWDF